MRTILSRIYRSLFPCKCATLAHSHNEREGYDEARWHGEVGGGDA